MPPTTHPKPPISAHSYSWEEESDRWPYLNDHDQHTLMRRDLGLARARVRTPAERWTKIVVIVIVVAAVVSLGGVAFSVGMVSRPDLGEKVEAR